MGSRMSDEPERIGIWGASGSGKSTYMHARLKGRKRLIVVDVSPGILRDKTFKICRTGNEVIAAMLANWNGFRLVYAPSYQTLHRGLNQICDMLITAQMDYSAGKHRNMITLAIDEMKQAFPAQGGPSLVPKFDLLCSLGRQHGVELIGSSQRIAEVHSTFRGNCGEAIVFQSVEGNDKTRSASTVGKRVAEINTLKQFEYFHRQRDGSVIKGKTKKR
jgi:hypothetical protein